MARFGLDHTSVSFVVICYMSLWQGGLIASAVGETQIATFVDDECRTSKQYFTAVDGYPDGACMNIASASTTSYGSFLISSLDSGCGGDSFCFSSLVFSL